MLSYPRAILHIDGDAFFASCEQARNPKLQGRPVITGKERGIASSMSYEAKARGVIRGMRLFEIKKLCPDAIIMPSDYETYSLLSQRLFSIVRRYTPDVEEYGIDECFADITGLRRVYRTGYEEIGKKIQNDLSQELGFTFSIGLAPNKVVAKIGSKWRKPAGFTAISGRNFSYYLEKWPIEKIWGIGPQTAAYLNKLGIINALQFANKNEYWIKSRLTKPYYEIWQELNGQLVYQLSLEPKVNYCSIQKMKTFTPPSRDKKFILSQFSKNIENACIKLRRYNLATERVIFYLRSQDFRGEAIELDLPRPTAIPLDLITLLESNFSKLFDPSSLYRTTGVILLKLAEDKKVQLDIFGQGERQLKLKKIYGAIDEVNGWYGKHKIFLGSSFQANTFSQHLSDRGDAPVRNKKLFLGENKRRRIGIPMFLN